VTVFHGDLRRTLLAPATIATLLVAVVLAGILAPGHLPPGNGYFGFAVSYEYADGGFDFWILAYNGSGHPVSGADAFVLYLASSNVSANSSAAPIPINRSATTESDGIAAVVIPGNDASGTVTIGVLGNSASTEFNLGIEGYELDAVPPGTVAPYWGTFGLVDTGRYGLAPQMLVFDPGSSGGPPAGASLQVDAITPPPHAGRTLVAAAPVVAAVTILDVPFTGLPRTTATVNYTLLGPGDTPVAADVEQASSLALLNYTAPSWGYSLSSEASVWGFLAPVLGVGIGYAVYGRERAARALEPVVALPTTRFGLFLRRYLAGCLALALGTGLAVLVGFDARGPISTGVSPALLGAIWGALLLEALAFLGLTVLLSHVLRSGGTVAAVGVGFAAFLAFLVVPLEYLAGDLNNVQPSSLVLQQTRLVNPTHLPNAAIAAYFAGFGAPGILSSGSIAGETQLALALGVTALLAVITPVLGGMLAAGRD
jgi:ABC-type transport system involved in multi-copper enzyme maturation permease subunit